MSTLRTVALAVAIIWTVAIGGNCLLEGMCSIKANAERIQNHAQSIR